uniref:Uncharacterized protein n=1 Tax=Rhizophagus irregularis (strain DAOM 181602 / DAOM 197198 / MUCL 43194) TaxID=747089 RepID=U9U0E1_RHIID
MNKEKINRKQARFLFQSRISVRLAEQFDDAIRRCRKNDTIYATKTQGRVYDYTFCYYKEFTSYARQTSRFVNQKFT